MASSKRTHERIENKSYTEAARDRNKKQMHTPRARARVRVAKCMSVDRRLRRQQQQQ